MLLLGRLIGQGEITGAAVVSMSPIIYS